ncbi:MAG TPA: glutathione peroxidase [Mycobacteriales bacterium]|jgi:glutathione peroxidase|nr:glutathione peroxidase [Mycobacteriales bacterium]
MTSLRDLPVTALDGTPTTFGAITGDRVTLVVNVASKCGLTPQYAKLEALQRELDGAAFTVVGFPCNQFGGQEPGTSEEIATFCSTTYGVSFPMTSKVEVNGEGRDPIYTELTGHADAEGAAGDIQWNFEKFVVGRDGEVLGRFRPLVEPDDPALRSCIDGALGSV